MDGEGQHGAISGMGQLCLSQQEGAGAGAERCWSREGPATQNGISVATAGRRERQRQCDVD